MPKKEHSSPYIFGTSGTLFELVRNFSTALSAVKCTKILERGSHCGSALQAKLRAFSFAWHRCGYTLTREHTAGDSDSTDNRVQYSTVRVRTGRHAASYAARPSRGRRQLRRVTTWTATGLQCASSC